MPLSAATLGALGRSIGSNAHMITSPALPFEPEPLDSLVSRFPAAVAEEFDSEQILLLACAGTFPPPSSSRKHVFDFLCGLRMIATAERLPTGRRFIHLSVAMMGGQREVLSREQALSVLAPFIGKTVRPALEINSGVALHVWLER